MTTTDDQRIIEINCKDTHIDPDGTRSSAGGHLVDLCYPCWSGLSDYLWGYYGPAPRRKRKVYEEEDE